jgi:hypothetical protein
MMNRLHNIIRQDRLARNECPYCAEPFRRALVFDQDCLWGKESMDWLAILCPDLHHGFLEVLYFDPPALEYRQLDNDGRPIPIPQENIRWVS